MADNFEGTPSAAARRRPAKSTDIRFSDIKAGEMLEGVDNTELLPDINEKLVFPDPNHNPNAEKPFDSKTQGVDPQDPNK